MFQAPGSELTKTLGFTITYPNLFANSLLYGPFTNCRDIVPDVCLCKVSVRLVHLGVR